MSSRTRTRQNTLASDSTSSFSPLENTETHADEEEEYIPLLTSHHHSLDNLESDVEEEEADTGNVRRVRRKPATVTLPPPPNFEHFVHPKPLHRAFINLPPNYEANFSKPINLFLLFFPNFILDTIVVNKFVCINKRR